MAFSFSFTEVPLTYLIKLICGAELFQLLLVCKTLHFPSYLSDTLGILGCSFPSFLFSTILLLTETLRLTEVRKMPKISQLIKSSIKTF